MSIVELCRTATTGRSTYYKWKERSNAGPLDEALVEKVFIDKKAKAGARKIRMYLEREYGVIFNLKKIRRIMKLKNLVVKIRRRRQHFYQLKNTQHKVMPNRLKQNFKVTKPDKIFSTDITYLTYNKGERAYLSAVKDLATKEIVHHVVSKHIDVSIVTNGLSNFLKVIPRKKHRRIIVHSDQGAHYTSDFYRKILKENGIQQSMSRKGNCLDNAPIESFFGHFKDEAEYKNCKSYDELKSMVDNYIKYYNNERPQWGLKGKTPAEYRGFIS